MTPGTRQTNRYPLYKTSITLSHNNNIPVRRARNDHLRNLILECSEADYRLEEIKYIAVTEVQSLFFVMAEIKKEPITNEKNGGKIL